MSKVKEPRIFYFYIHIRNVVFLEIFLHAVKW